MNNPIEFWIHELVGVIEKGPPNPCSTSHPLGLSAASPVLLPRTRSHGDNLNVDFGGATPSVCLLAGNDSSDADSTGDTLEEAQIIASGEFESSILAQRSELAVVFKIDWDELSN